MQKLTKHQIKREIQKNYKRNQEIVLILENIQYARNVASTFRTADAAGVRKIYLTGISHNPPFGKELSQVSRSKEKSVQWEKLQTTEEAIRKLKKDGFTIIAIELTDNAIELSGLKDKLKNLSKICFLAGSEVYGVTKSTLEMCDLSVFIPMYGKGASLNVSASVAITLFSI